MSTRHFCIAAIFFMAFVSAHAQTYEAGGGLSYGSGINNMGINLRGEILFNEQLSVSSHFNFFFGRDEGMLRHKWWAFNIDGHYYFKVDDLLFLYPLLGFNIGTVKEKWNGINFSDTEIGMNLGGGLKYQFTNTITGFGEIKYVIGNADQFVVTAGVMITLPC